MICFFFMTEEQKSWLFLSSLRLFFGNNNEAPNTMAVCRCPPSHCRSTVDLVMLNFGSSGFLVVLQYFLYSRMNTRKCMPLTNRSLASPAIVDHRRHAPRWGLVLGRWGDILALTDCELQMSGPLDPTPRFLIVTLANGFRRLKLLDDN